MPMDPLLAGMLSGAVGIGLLSKLSSLPSELFQLVRRGLYVECVIDNEDSIYHWAMVWLGSRPEIARSGAVRVVSNWAAQPGETGQARQTVLAPGDGDHLIRYDGRRLWITLTSKEQEMSQTRTRTMRVRCRKKHRPVLHQMLAEIADSERFPEPHLTKVYVPEGGGWSVNSKKRRRLPDSVVLDGALGRTIERVVTEFVASEQRYRDRGIPYRLGILLEGPPGNGKSTLALMVAAVLGRGLYVVPLGDPTLSDGSLLRLMASAPPADSVVLMEDVDTVFVGRERTAENKLTLSGLLGAIDGPLAPEGRVLIMTTNHPERLDEALIRPGRADRRFHIGNASVEQARQMYLRFSPGDEQRACVFAHSATGRSMAAIQCELIDLTARD